MDDTALLEFSPGMNYPNELLLAERAQEMP